MFEITVHLSADVSGEHILTCYSVQFSINLILMLILWRKELKNNTI